MNYINTEELINGMKHMADDHPCCAQTIKTAIGRIGELENAIKVISIWSGADDPRRETRTKAMSDIHGKAQSVLFHNTEHNHAIETENKL